MDAESVTPGSGGAAPTACRGVRGAVTTDATGQDAVAAATIELLEALVQANGFRTEDVAAAIFTVTTDLGGTNPAAAARLAGWASVPLLVVQEHAGDSGVPRCIRVLLLWNTSLPQDQIRHRYLRGAAQLRPDLVSATEPTGSAR
jgi:chorismate mutase